MVPQRVNTLLPSNGSRGSRVRSTLTGTARTVWTGVIATWQTQEYGSLLRERKTTNCRLSILTDGQAVFSCARLNVITACLGLPEWRLPPTNLVGSVVPSSLTQMRSVSPQRS